jgi:hypothetical protein
MMPLLKGSSAFQDDRKLALHHLDGAPMTCLIHVFAIVNQHQQNIDCSLMLRSRGDSCGRAEAFQALQDYCSQI